MAGWPCPVRRCRAGRFHPNLPGRCVNPGATRCAVLCETTARVGCKITLPAMAAPDDPDVAPSADGALDGISILDLTTGIAGPLGVLLLAEQGARGGEGGTARWRPPALDTRFRRLAQEPPLGDPRSRRRRGTGEVPRSACNGRRARGELCSGNDGVMGPRIRGHLPTVARLSSSLRLPPTRPRAATPAVPATTL